ncbi:hypothetical protein SO802_007420 [Lithocarpus litseifolius]|uniref:Uncharacterized protein n=1 Tax=Lithocarpus litseifolius TaxID=425828 RepID=A0AAW2DNZ8_9ROSI
MELIVNYLPLLNSCLITSKPVKFLLDNLQAAFKLNHRNLFKKTLQALEIHLINLSAQNEVYEGLLVDLIPDNPVDQNKSYIDQHVNPLPKNMAFESHSVNHDPFTNQLFGKEKIHSLDKMTIMGTNFARLSLKTQSQLRTAVANLPTEIQMLTTMFLFNSVGKNTLEVAPECMKEDILFSVA